MLFVLFQPNLRALVGRRAVQGLASRVFPALTLCLAESALSSELGVENTGFGAVVVTSNSATP
jgi:hypothetical protein